MFISSILKTQNKKRDGYQPGPKCLTLTQVNDGDVLDIRVKIRGLLKIKVGLVV